MHISSLPGEYLIGSFGKEARDFVDFLDKGGFSGMKAFQLGFTDEKNSPRQPHNYPRNRITYMSTHNNTLLGYVWRLMGE